MTVSLENVDLGLSHQPDQAMQHLMYFVKRPAYELVVTLPDNPQGSSYADHVCCHVRLKASGHVATLVLDVKALQYFYEDVSSMMEYLHDERHKPRVPALTR